MNPFSFVVNLLTLETHVIFLGEKVPFKVSWTIYILWQLYTNFWLKLLPVMFCVTSVAPVRLQGL